MALLVSTQALPRCVSCVRSLAWGSLGGSGAQSSTGSMLHARGKKKLAKQSKLLTVRLLRDVDRFGRSGSLVPITRGQMRNQWFPRRIAEYVTVPELKDLRLKNTPIERDFLFGASRLRGNLKDGVAVGAVKSSSVDSATATSRTNLPEVQHLTSERSLELVELWVPPRINFYRQQILEGKESEKAASPPNQPMASSAAAADLLAMRTESTPETARRTDSRPIYGSVSIQDVLVALRAAMATNEEAARVVLTEEEVTFVDLPAEEDSRSGRVKHIGDFAVEIKFRGANRVLRRVVGVTAQET